MQETNKNKAVFAHARRTMIALAVASAFPLHAAYAVDTPVAAPADAAADQSGAPQAAPEAKAPGQLEQIIVTAQRRRENIKDVPMAISTIKGENLDTFASGGEDIRFLAARVPSVNVESDFGRSFPRFYIRGLGNTDFDLNASQPVSLIFDDIVQENPIIKGFPVFDLDQVEVLRGPQGTLFGRNSPAGVIKFDSAKPGRNFEGYANIGVGNFGVVNLEGAVNVPLSEDWAMRFSAQAQHRNDRVNNTYAAGPTRSFEGYDDDAARLQFMYKPNATFSALFNIHARDMKGNATLFRANTIQKGTNELVPNFDYNSYPTDGANKQTLNSNGASVRLRWDFDGMTLHSITGYESATFYSRGDVDGGVSGVNGAPSFPGFIPFSAETADGLPSLKQFTQEVRLESNTKDPLQWIAGAYYFNEDIHVDSFDYNSLGGNVQDGYANQHQTSKAWAMFGSVNYAVTNQFKLRAGLRYTSDSKDFVAQRLWTPGSAPGVNTVYKTASPSSHNTSWDLSGTYELSKATNLYGRIATGYRAPSIQGRVLFGDDISVAKPETVLSYEAGIKQDLFDRRARASFSVFQYRVSDMQLTAGNGTTNQNQLVNASKVTGQGFEFDFQANLSDNLKATVGGSYNDTEIKDPSLTVTPCGAGCVVLNPINAQGQALINGNPLPQAPKWVGNFTLRYGIPYANGELFAFTDWSYRGETNYFLYKSVEFTGKSLLEGGLRAGYKWGDGKYELALFARNITNRVQAISAIDFNNLAAIVNEPRAFGVQFKGSF